VLARATHQGGRLAIVQFVDHAQLQGLSLGGGQGVQGIGQLRGAPAGVHLRLDRGQLVEIVVKLDSELSARRQLGAPPAVVAAHEVARDPEKPAARGLVTGTAEPPQRDQRLLEPLGREVRRSRHVRRLGTDQRFVVATWSGPGVAPVYTQRSIAIA
jgi:hypothetical protein